jgi:adenosylcobinamide kinase / adenosylcobinamide-phosphate guanylyltransferase
MGRIVAYIGGARSGKSRLAQERVANAGTVVYVATATRTDHSGTKNDPEMDARIERHRNDRPKEWVTIEEPHDLARAFQRASEHKPGAILLDCLTLWLSNRLLASWPMDETASSVPPAWNDKTEESLLLEMEKSLSVGKNGCNELVVVSNEVGGGLVPLHPMGRAFQDLQGRANQRLGRIADEVHWVLAGLTVKMKG